MWWKAEATDIHRVEDRVSTIYVERCHIDRADNAIVFINKENTVRLPAAMIAAVMLGPGTRITHQAVALLANSGTSVCWVGEHGVRLYAAGMGSARGAKVAIRQAKLVSNQQERLRIARAMYQMRFLDEDVSNATMQQLRGREGARVKQLYKEHSNRTGVAWSRREYRVGDAFGSGNDVNRVLSAANAALYGIAHAAIVGVGAIPSLGFVHVGSMLSFVHDIADLYKAKYTIPLAFDLVAAGRIDESDARYELRDRFAKDKFMSQIVKDILYLIMGDELVSSEDEHTLWDAKSGAVKGGVNWADDLNDDFGYYVISGPTLSEVKQ